MQFCWRHDLDFKDDQLLWSAPFSCVQGTGTEQLLRIHTLASRDSPYSAGTQSLQVAADPQGDHLGIMCRRKQRSCRKAGVRVCVCWWGGVGGGRGIKEGFLEEAMAESSEKNTE